MLGLLCGWHAAARSRAGGRGAGARLGERDRAQPGPHRGQLVRPHVRHRQHAAPRRRVFPVPAPTERHPVRHGGRPLPARRARRQISGRRHPGATRERPWSSRRGSRTSRIIWCRRATTPRSAGRFFWNAGGSLGPQHGCRHPQPLHRVRGPGERLARRRDAALRHHLRLQLHGPPGGRAGSGQGRPLRRREARLGVPPAAARGNGRGERAHGQHQSDRPRRLLAQRGGRVERRSEFSTRQGRTQRMDETWVSFPVAVTCRSGSAAAAVENDPAHEDVAVIARARVVDPDGAAGTGDELFETVAEGGAAIRVGSGPVRTDRLDTIVPHGAGHRLLSRATRRPGARAGPPPDFRLRPSLSLTSGPRPAC